MSQKAVVKTFKLADGREISIETGKLAKQADGSIVLRMGDCMLLATAVSSPDAKPGVDFMPLTVDRKSTRLNSSHSSVSRMPSSA